MSEDNGFVRAACRFELVIRVRSEFPVKAQTLYSHDRSGVYSSSLSSFSASLCGPLHLCVKKQCGECTLLAQGRKDVLDQMVPFRVHVPKRGRDENADGFPAGRHGRDPWRLAGEQQALSAAQIAAPQCSRFSPSDPLNSWFM